MISTKSNVKKTNPITKRPKMNVTEVLTDRYVDCEHSIVSALAQDRPILTCRNKAVAPGRLWVVGAEECCANFTRDKELPAPEPVQVLAEGAS